MAWTHILECSDGSYHVGSTRDLDQRLFDHERGLGAAYTKTRPPVTLVASFESDNVEEAYLFEKQVQGWSRAKKKAIIDGRFDGLPAQSRKGYRPSVQDPGSANPNGRGQAPWEMRRGRPHWLED
ncbi:GIY-YIG nuclease family protein [Naasia lichenicola]|uniref:GIY-YIG nuclease family protein n=1 Tax=Naasia lichenicola TaxID=2565933 RepID=A0A4S4FST7_9MICO|nr:GIY-YIG nuclease family protein [Naasia lichenicola]THG33371.1 GIY-YIG nuclease family protein [Naasia lichenicola]